MKYYTMPFITDSTNRREREEFFPLFIAVKKEVAEIQKKIVETEKGRRNQSFLWISWFIPRLSLFIECPLCFCCRRDDHPLLLIIFGPLNFVHLLPFSSSLVLLIAFALACCSDWSHSWEWLHLKCMTPLVLHWRQMDGWELNFCCHWSWDSEEEVSS